MDNTRHRPADRLAALRRRLGAGQFEVTQHDFGTVAAHAKAEFSFRFTNKYLYEVRVASVRSSCGCSDVRVTKNSLASYETGEIVASIRSERLRGEQSSTLTVIFDKPRYAEVQLRVTVFIRGDVLIEPAGFDFGEVEHGAEASRKVTVTHFGATDWKIVDVLAGTDFAECELGEPVRSDNRVSYPLTAWLTASAPPGDLRTQLLLVTSDPRAAKIPVMVEGSIRPPVSVSPASLYLGSLRPGELVTKRLVARASKPFRILEIAAECDCFEFTYSTDEAKMPHLIPIKFTALHAASKIEPQLASIVEELRAIRGQGGLALDPSASAAPATMQDSTMVYYFHSSFRCQTCRDIEDQAHAVVLSDFADQLATGTIQWQTLNYEQPAGHKLAKQFDVSMPVVVLARYEDGQISRWKSLDRVWGLVGDKPAYAAFVREEIQQMLGAAATETGARTDAPGAEESPASHAPLDIPVPENIDLPIPEFPEG